jgi:hypothetical protein
MVWTRETGMRAIASELRMWPPIWNAVKGSVAFMMSLFGLLIPFFKTGIALRTLAYRLANQDRKMHQNETRKNCIIVSVIGFGKAVRMAFEDVFVKIDAANQVQHNPTRRYDTGAFNDSAISCAFSLILAFLILTVRIASLRLFCRPCLVPPALPFAQAAQPPGFDSFLNGHLSLECRPTGSPFMRGFGLGPRDMSSSVSSPLPPLSSWMKSGNLKVVGAAWLDEERRRSSPAVAWGTIL